MISKNTQIYLVLLRQYFDHCISINIDTTAIILLAIIVSQIETCLGRYTSKLSSYEIITVILLPVYVLYRAIQSPIKS